MDKNLKKAWMDIVQADDLDSHMLAIGQAQTNAVVVREMLQKFPISPGGRFWLAGCGTGQIFDLIDPLLFESCHLTLTDINAAFLKKAEERLVKFKNLKFTTVIDDIETTRLSDNFEAVLLILVLEHVDWKKALDAVAARKPQKLYFIIQAQQADVPLVTMKRELKPSIKKFAETAKAHLIDQGELEAYLGVKGFVLLETVEENVADGKRMVGLVFGGKGSRPERAKRVEEFRD